MTRAVAYRRFQAAGRALVRCASVVVFACSFAWGVTAPTRAQTIDRAEAERWADAAGALLVVGVPGASETDPAVRMLGRDLARGRVGGVLMFEAALRGREASARLIAWLRAQAPRDVLILVDQEGGRVARLRARNGFRDWPSAAAVGRLAPDARGLDRATSLYRGMARELREIGIDVNLGPVVDVALEPRNPIITRLGRSFGRDPAVVSAFAETFLRAHAELGVGTCLKHFPGHGSATADTHLEAVSLEGRWRPDVELEPYRRLLAARAPTPCVMTSHLFVPDLAGEDRAIVTFSPTAIALLREDLGFQGLIISDDLTMAAAGGPSRAAASAARALAAGHDMIIVAQAFIGGVSTAERFRAAVLDALIDGRLTRERLDAALRRRRAMTPTPAE